MALDERDPNYDTSTASDTTEEEKGGLLKFEPALVGSVVTAVLALLVTYGVFTPDVAAQWGQVLTAVLAVLGVGGAVGVAVRQSVTPVAKQRLHRK